MAMNGNTMGQEVATAIMNSEATPEAKAAATELWQKICTAIVNHITTNAVVPAGITVATSGGPTSQTGSTTATGSVS